MTMLNNIKLLSIQQAANQLGILDTEFLVYAIDYPRQITTQLPNGKLLNGKKMVVIGEALKQTTKGLLNLLKPSLERNLSRASILTNTRGIEKPLKN